MNTFPRISFGIIVLNGEPFTKYCLRNLYPFAHEIIVVEGGSKNAVEFAPEGHSTDGTRESLFEFKEKEDPENKVKIITKEGFWEEKNEQSQAYARIATGDYLWQVDVDEFYKHEDVEKIIEMLRGNPDITQVSFKAIAFWGGFDYIYDSWKMRSRGLIEEIPRLFKWGVGYQYVTHRPTTIRNSKGKNLRDLYYINGRTLAGKGIFQHHYSTLFPRIVLERCQYHLRRSGSKTRKHLENWAEDVFMNLKNPYNVDMTKSSTSWLERFRGKHPDIIYQLQNDIKKGEINVEIRQTEDIELLLESPRYKIGRTVLKYLSFSSTIKRIVKSVVKKVTGKHIFEIKQYLRHVFRKYSYRKVEN